MKTTLKYVFGFCQLASFALASAFAQTALPQFDYIIIVVQENRTPDNLFGSGPSSAKCGIEDLGAIRPRRLSGPRHADGPGRRR